MAQNNDCLVAGSLQNPERRARAKCLKLIGSNASTHFNGLKKMPGLRRLTISRANITNVPELLSSYHNLRYLDLSRNKLENFPREILELKKLRKLDLSNNPLKSLPQDLSELKNLEVLIIWNTRIEDLPADITQLKNLKYINWRKSQAPRNRANYWEEKLDGVDILYSPDCNCY